MTVSINLTDPNLSDGDLDQLRVDVLNEQERRQRLAELPRQVADMARRFVADGGDLTTIHAAIAELE